MKLINHVQNLLFGIAFCIIQVYPDSCRAQKASVILHYELDSVFKKALENTSKPEIDFFIKDTGRILDDNRRNEKYMRLPTLITGLELNLPDGMYDFRFVIRSSFSVKGLETYGFGETIYDSSFKYISVSNSKPTVLNLFLKNNCPFRRDVRNNVCPKCMSNENVIPICKGLPLVDYECHEDPKYSHCSPPACSPTWYCKTDKLEF